MCSHYFYFSHVLSVNLFYLLLYIFFCLIYYISFHTHKVTNTFVYSLIFSLSLIIFLISNNEIVGIKSIDRFTHTCLTQKNKLLFFNLVFEPKLTISFFYSTTYYYFYLIPLPVSLCIENNNCNYCFFLFSLSSLLFIYLDSRQTPDTNNGLQAHIHTHT